MLGCLVEKQLTTPQQYPLTLNALTLAADQATNRDPVVTLDDDDVLAAVDELRAGHLARVVLPSHGRSVSGTATSSTRSTGSTLPTALLAVLLLRGPQTVGELRARSERMVDFPTVAEVQAGLQVLAEHSAGLGRSLPRRPGQKEDRWHQVLASPWTPDMGPVDTDGGTRPSPHDDGGGGRPDRDGPTPGHDARPGAPAGAAPSPDPKGPDGLQALRAEVEALRGEVAAAPRHDLADLRRGLGE